MTPDLERFMDLATRPLEDRPEQIDEAKTELMSRVSHQGLPLESLDLSGEVARLEQAKFGKPWIRRALVLAGFLGLLVATVAMAGVLVMAGVLSAQAQMMGYSVRFHGAASDVRQGTMLGRWVMRGAPGIPLRDSSDGALEEAIRRSPEDVALFQQELIRARNAASSGWPGLTSVQRDKAERIDSGNGYYDFIEIPGFIETAIGGRSHRSSASPAITDERAFSAALGALERVSEAPGFRDASGELKRRQVEALPRSRSFLDESIRPSFCQFVISSLPVYQFSGIASVDVLIETQAKRLEKAADVEGLLDLRDQVLALLRLLIEDSEKGGVADQGIHDLARKSLIPIQAGLAKLGRSYEAGKLDKFTASSPGVKYRLNGLSWAEESPSLRLTKWQAAPRDLGFDEVIPAGKTERALFQRVLALVAAFLVLLMTVFVAIEAYRRPRRIVGMAKGLLPLLDWKDWGWIAGLGIAFPWAWLLLVSLLTPLGLRDLPLGYEDGIGMLIFVIQASSALILGATLMVWAAYWRWEKRGRLLAFRGGAMMVGKISALLTALAIPAAGLTRYFHLTASDEQMMFVAGVSGMAASGLLWLIWITVINLCTPNKNALGANVAMRTVLPVVLLGLVTLLMCAHVQHLSERAWLEKDGLFPSWTSETHANALEERVAVDVRKQLLALLKNTD